MTERRRQKNLNSKSEQTHNRRLEDKVVQIIEKYADDNIVTFDSRLKGELGFDSLTMMELMVELESTFSISIADVIGTAKTVRDIVVLIESGGTAKDGLSYNIEDYPLPKTENDIKKLKRFMRLSRIFWRFNISGLEHIPTIGSYILCPNHQSHYDGLWVWTSIGDKHVDISRICCLAKQEHLDSKRSRSGLVMLGGIPVDRRGNTIPAMKRALECIQDGYTMLVHPEGTRTLDGKIHEFKGGAAKLAVDAGVPLIPVRIEGAWDIYPPHRKAPRIISRRGRYPLYISFGKPIVPHDRTVEELTTILQNEVERLGEAV